MCCVLLGVWHILSYFCVLELTEVNDIALECGTIRWKVIGIGTFVLE